MSKRQRARQRGEGSIYLRGEKWWIKYYYNGKPQYEATGAQRDCGPAAFGASEERAAWTYLANVKRKTGAAELGHTYYVGGAAQKLRMAELLDAVVTRYKAICIRDNKSITDHALVSGVKRAKDWFGEMRAVDVTNSFWERWMCERLPALRQQYRPATINRTLAYVRQSFRLAARDHRISTIPSDVSAVMLLKEEKENARQGFFEREEFERLLAATADEDLRDFYTFAYLTGWRSGSIKKLQWETVDMTQRLLVSRGRDEKTGRKNVLTMGEGVLWALMQRREARRAYATESGLTLQATYVFHRQGTPIGDIRKSWANACVAAGLTKTITIGGQPLVVPSKLFHDFRRTAARDMVRAHIRKAVVKTITGHLTDSVFDRYDIVEDDEKVDAIEARMAHPRKQGQAMSSVGKT